MRSEYSLRYVVSFILLFIVCLTPLPVSAAEGNTEYAQQIAEQFEKIKIVKFAKVVDGPDQPVAKMVLLINLELFNHLPMYKKKNAIKTWSSTFSENFPNYAISFAVYSLEKEKIAHVLRKTDDQGNLLDLEYQFYDPGNEVPVATEIGSDLEEKGSSVPQPEQQTTNEPQDNSSAVIATVVIIILVGLLFLGIWFFSSSKNKSATDSAEENNEEQQAESEQTGGTPPEKESEEND
jgi:ATP-dependent Zn protease